VTVHAHADGGPAALLVLAAPLAALLLYAWGVRRVRHAGRPWSPRRTAAFALGTVLLAVSLAPPLAGHEDFRAHVAQHLLLGMLAPVALALGAPATLALRATRREARRPLAPLLRGGVLRAATHPASVVLLNAGGLFALYLTPLYAATRESAGLHVLVHAHMLVAGYLLAWTLVAADPVPHRPGTATRLAALLAAAAAHAVLAKLLYAHGLAGDAGHTAAEVRAGAELMYYGGDVAEIALAIAVLAGWRRERVRRDRRRAVAAGVAVA